MFCSSTVCWGCPSSLARPSLVLLPRHTSLLHWTLHHGIWKSALLLEYPGRLSLWLGTCRHSHPWFQSFWHWISFQLTPLHCVLDWQWRSMTMKNEVSKYCMPSFEKHSFVVKVECMCCGMRDDSAVVENRITIRLSEIAWTWSIALTHSCYPSETRQLTTIKAARRDVFVRSADYSA